MPHQFTSFKNALTVTQVRVIHFFNRGSDWYNKYYKIKYLFKLQLVLFAPDTDIVTCFIQNHNNLVTSFVQNKYKRKINIYKVKKKKYI